MIAWVCPAATVRSTRRRISRLSQAWSLTLTCRSRISRVDMSLLLTGGDGHVNVLAVNPHRVGVEGPGGRRAGRLAGPQVEARAVQPALERVVVDLALGERDLLVGAELVERVHLAVGPDDHERRAVQFDPAGARVAYLIERAGPDELAHAMPFSSSASNAAAIRSRSPGISISEISPPKNPLITRRRASLNP